jgi:hypothetical protein
MGILEFPAIEKAWGRSRLPGVAALERLPIL